MNRVYPGAIIDVEDVSDCIWMNLEGLFIRRRGYSPMPYRNVIDTGNASLNLMLDISGWVVIASVVTELFLIGRYL